MTGFVVILAAMGLGAPVHCYTSQPVYHRAEAQAGIGSPVEAFYITDGPIALSPNACRNVLAPTLDGADTLRHELAHLQQWRAGRALDETEAAQIARWGRRALLRRLEKHLGRKAVPGPQPDPVVLAP